MNKTHTIFPLIAAVGMFPAIAMADVKVTATVDKQKDITITETITIDKTAVIDAKVLRRVQKAGEAQALVNQRNFDNELCTNCDEKRDILMGSGIANSGVLSINQAGGNMNNQGNAVSIAIDVPDDPGSPQTPENSEGFTDSQAHVDQKNFENLVDRVNLLFMEAHIQDSINDNSGVAHVNQAPGNMVNQSNVMSLAVSLASGGTALAEADLGQVNRNQQVLESDSQGRDQGDPGFVGINKDAQMIASVNGNTGVVGVNQSSGNMSNQANIVSFASAGVR